MAEESGETGAAGGAGQPSEEEVRAQLEEEIKKVKVDDVILQSLVSILNLTARRIAKADERDLGQGKQGIEAAQALLDHVPDEPKAQLQQAISELQMLYARGGEPAAEGEGGAGPGGGGGPEGPGGSGQGGGPGAGGQQGGQGSSGGLWTPHER